MNASASSVATANTRISMDKAKSHFGSYWGVYVFGISAAIMYITSFSMLSKFAGSKDDWNEIKPQLSKIWIITLVSTVLLTLAALFYFIQDPSKAMYFMLIISCISLGLAYSALAVAVISR